MVFESRSKGRTGFINMTEMLSPKELASLYTRLKVPMIVSDMLDRGTPPGADEHLALIIMLSEMTAERLLVSAACCARILASRVEGDAALASSLSLQSDFVLEDYGPLCLRRTGMPPDSHWLSYMQEDLEAMSELFMICADIIESGPAAEICRILQDQTLAHAEVLGQDGFNLGRPDSASVPDNVILFPMH
jgi:hypothetical protein